VSIIRAETDEIRNTGRAIEMASLDLEDSFREVRTAAYQLEANWQGGAAESFDIELMEWLRVMAEMIKQAEYFGRALAHQAEGWEEIDQRWTGAYRDTRTPETGGAVRA
jgi:WXG100 family type VII secretion target